MTRLAWALATIALAVAATPAHADPISLSIAGVLTSLGVGATVATVVAAVATFVITTGISMGLSKLFGPRANAQDRQASILSISIGGAVPAVIFADGRP